MIKKENTTKQVIKVTIISDKPISEIFEFNYNDDENKFEDELKYNFSHITTIIKHENITHKFIYKNSTILCACQKSIELFLKINQDTKITKNPQINIYASI